VEIRLLGDGKCLSGDVVVGEVQRDEVVISRIDVANVVLGELIQPLRR
jgi:hypothetical protein